MIALAQVVGSAWAVLVCLFLALILVGVALSDDGAD